MRRAMGECAVRLAQQCRLLRRRHDRVRGRPARQQLLLPGDEHPHPGRAPGHRDGHRARPGRRADPHRRRLAAAASRRTTSQLRGHAIECRINAEDPDRNFLPQPGADLATGTRRAAQGVRVDTHCYAGYTVPPYYDSLLGKLIVHAPTRERSDRTKMRRRCPTCRSKASRRPRAFHRLGARARTTSSRASVTTRWVEETFLPTQAAQKQPQAARQRAGAQP